MAEHRDHQADTYLRSGSNELKILQYTVGEDTFGINILKVSRILANMPAFTSIPESHPAVRGGFNDHDRVIPVMDLKYFFNGEKTDLGGRYRVIVTEFFGMLNAFLVDNVEVVHTVMWEQVKAAQSIMTIGKNPYVISIVQPDEERGQGRLAVAQGAVADVQAGCALEGGVHEPGQKRA
jgi:two-component system chemotaxis response regulator CheV